MKNNEINVDEICKKLFHFAIQILKENYNCDVSYLKLIIDTSPHYIDGSIVEGKPIGWSGGSWTQKRIIYINPLYEEVFKFYNIKIEGNPYNFICNYYSNIICHEMTHELYTIIWNDEIKNIIYNKALNDNSFYSPYIDYLKTTKEISEKKLKEEITVEYFGVGILSKNVIQRFFD